VTVARLLKAALLAYPIYWLSQVCTLPISGVASVLESVRLP
jgi:hypothetical protein